MIVSNISSERSNLPPVLLTQIASEIKSAGGSIWLLQRFDYGSLLRAEFGRKQFRVVIPPLTATLSAPIPDEGHSLLHVVKDLAALRAWLKTVCLSN
ncbi:hypothetical protein [Spirosoma jeollabukense]